MSDTPQTDLEILCAARKILRERAEKHGYQESYGANRVAFHAEAAETAVFKFLNNLNTWGGVEMTYEQLHGYPQPEPKSLRAPTCPKCGMSGQDGKHAEWCPVPGSVIEDPAAQSLRA